MSESSPPQNLEDLTVGYVLGNLSPHEAEEFRQLLAQNPKLHQDIAQWQEVLGLLPYAQVQAPPTRLRNTILAAIEKPSDIAPRAKSLVLPWDKIVAGTAVMFALALGLDGYNLRQQFSQSSQVISVLQGAKTHIYSLKSKESKSTAVGSVFMDFEANKAVIALQDVPPPPVGKTYWLWAVVGNHTIRCGQIKGGSGGTSLDKISIPANVYGENAEISQLFVTIESAAPTHPVGKVVLIKAS
jgi:anti-sigma-K factor RskA